MSERETTHARSRLVVGVDSSPTADAAAIEGECLSRGLGGELVFAHAADSRAPLTYSAEAAPPDGRVHVERGSPPAVLNSVAQTESAELIVVGSRGRGRLSAALFGSTSAELAKIAVRPVVIATPPSVKRRAGEREARSIVCGVDASPQSIRAREVARALATRLGLKLRTIHVGSDSLPDHLAHLSAKQIDAFDIAGMLRVAALREEARLLVVGSTQRSMLESMRRSVARTLIATAPVPLVVVPETAQTEQLVDPVPWPLGDATNGQVGVPALSRTP